MDAFMEAAIQEARLSRQEGGVPIGAVLVQDGIIIGRGHNQRVQKNNPILHAEIDCLQNAGRIGGYRGTIPYSTLMPCFYCGGAVIQFGIPKVVSGETVHGIGSRDYLKQQGVEIIEWHIQECIQLMDEFIIENPGLWQEDCGVL